MNIGFGRGVCRMTSPARAAFDGDIGFRLQCLGPFSSFRLIGQLSERLLSRKGYSCGIRDRRF